MPMKKKGSQSAKVGKRKGSGKSASSAKKKRSKSAISQLNGGAEIKREPDMLDPAAMYNLYYIAHGVVDALELRGFGWEGAPKKKKGKKGKKKK